MRDNDERETSDDVSLCFEPSQRLGIMSGLNKS